MKLQDIEPISSADYLVTIEGLKDIYFISLSGGEEEIERPSYTDAYASAKRTAKTGRVMISDVTIRKPYDPLKDQPLYAFIAEHRSGKDCQISARPVERGTDVIFRGTQSRKYSLCKLKKVKQPDVNLDEPTKISEWELTFSADLLTYS